MVAGRQLCHGIVRDNAATTWDYRLGRVWGGRVACICSGVLIGNVGGEGEFRCMRFEGEAGAGHNADETHAGACPWHSLPEFTRPRTAAAAVPDTTAIVREPAQAAGSDFRDLRFGAAGGAMLLMQAWGAIRDFDAGFMPMKSGWDRRHAPHGLRT